MQHTFVLQTKWDGGRNAVGDLQAQRLQTQISIPPEMDGPGIGTNPDEMLLGAAATCYIISLAAMLERANIKATLDMQSDGIVDVTNGVFTYQQIIHKLTLKLAERTEKNEKMAERLAFKAESTCMISKALKGNVEVLVKLTIE
ncbi:OsmC family protein [Metasolibacillus sp.]|uniref:OsmC family protein n=1 Tax=Metasolibacillus sp. TaxID=2703680 RepID=UPI0025E6283C|nr:OsmC family protein [Metasolibacillus sp.]MCT6925720.1 OsmC family protein [Metasolibacillus sp.]MCT6941876.1 OsmC family protein [Metasolibacillus sp.]